MKRDFCNQCFRRVACTRICDIVKAELKAKGIYDVIECGSLAHKKKEIDLVFWFDPYHERIIPEDSNYDEESKP